MNYDIKTDLLGFLYNMTTGIEMSRIIAVQNSAVRLLFNIINNPKEIDKNTLLMSACILKELCTNAVNPTIHSKLMSEDIMKILLQLSKTEIIELKSDVSSCVFDLTKSSHDNTVKVIEENGIEVLYYLTLNDNLDFHEDLRLYTSLALCNMTANSQLQCVMVANSVHIMPIMKSIILSNNEETLTHIATTVFNLMIFESSKVLMLKKNVIGIVFDLAATGAYLITQLIVFLLHTALYLQSKNTTHTQKHKCVQTLRHLRISIMYFVIIKIDVRFCIQKLRCK